MFHPRRELGRTGFKAALLGIGDIADRSIPLEQEVATLRRAMDAGLNVIDTAPGYEDGYSERIVGEALKGRRDGMFVIDKIDFHDRPVAPQVEGSLVRMQMDHADAFVFHGCSTMEGWNKLLAPGGPMEQLDACRRQGKCRFVGISSHHPDVLRTAVESGRCDALMFAIGPWCDRRYETEVLPLAKSRGVGTVCFKTFGAGKFLGDTAGYGRPLTERPRGKFSSGGSDGRQPHLTVAQCVRYTLTADPDVALLGMSFPNEQDAAFEAATGFLTEGPFSPERMDGLRREARAAIEGKGPCWWNPS